MPKILLQPLYFFAAASILLIVAPLLGLFYWALELATYLFPHSAAVLLIIAPLLLIAGKRLEAAICFAFATMGILFVMPFYVPTQPQTSCNPVQRALLINLLKENRDYQRVTDYVRSANPDIVVFEEVTPAWDDALRDLRDEYPYWKSVPRADHTGIALLSKIPDIEAEIATIGGNSPPSVVSNYVLNGSPVLVIGTHPPPPFGPIAADAKKLHFQELAQIIKSHDGAVIVLGDLNMTSRSSLFQWFVHDTHLRDTRLGFGLQPTFPVSSPLFRIDIDHALVSSGVAVQSRRLGPDLGSDHYPVGVDYSIQC